MQPTGLDESAAPAPTEPAPDTDSSPVADVAADTTADVAAPKESELSEPSDLPTEGPTQAASDESVSSASEDPAPTEHPAKDAQQPEAAEATQEDATPTPAEVPAPAAAPTVPAEPAIDPQEAMDAAKWGRVDGEGRVYVQDGGAEREVGQFPDAPIAEAMAFYVRRYLDLKATIDLFATRLPQLSVREIDSTLSSISESLTEPAAVGDLEGLRARFAALKTVAAERREAVSAERAAAKEQALKERTAIVERAEAIAEQDPARTQWKNSGAELRELLESWKAAQRRGPRLDRPTEDGLWKRFSHARTTFDRHRRQFFSELDAKQAQVRAAKEALIKRAEEMQTSTDWAGTSAKYRDLLAEWKKAGRASRKEDDALWARFRAAQQVFYDARRAKDEAVDAEFAENLKVKEALVAKAEALLPIKDIKAAKKALRPIQDAWEEAGRVPRGAVRRIEGRMRAVEDAIREAENAEWRRTDPETKARAEGLAGQLQDAIAGLEKDLAAAQATGDAKKIAETEAALTARRAWLEQVLRSAKA
ncbi:ATPase [Actinomyces oris]|nr:ATPase [Actinomyces oris]